MTTEKDLRLVEGHLAKVEVAEGQTVEGRRQLFVIPEGEAASHS